MICRSLPRLLLVVLICLTLTNGVMCIGRLIKNTFGTNPNSVVYGNGENLQLQEYYFDQNGVKIKSGNTDWAKEIFGTALMQNYNLSLSKGFKDGNVALTLNYMNRGWSLP